MVALYRNFETRAEIDKEYDVEQSVPDFMVYARDYEGSSAATRRRLNHNSDLRYGATIEEYIDIFPAERPNAPVLIFIHGGYWRILSAKEFSFVAQGPQSAGVTTVIVNYALCPKVTLDEIVRQIRAAIQWTHANIRDFNGDPDRLYVSGHSAGGHMTAMSLLTDWQADYRLPKNVIKGGISISGLFDIAPLQHSFMQKELRLDPAIIERNSPQYKVHSVSTPLLITYGGDETPEFSRQSEDFSKAWAAKGNKVRRVSLPGKNHFNAISGFGDSQSPLCQAIFKLMNFMPRRASAFQSRRHK
tara:strand:+ start:1067 stop:1972 length:906 start_codon:yes stop_codon:yes gene_type:complete